MLDYERSLILDVGSMEITVAFEKPLLSVSGENGLQWQENYKQKVGRTFFSRAMKARGRWSLVQGGVCPSSRVSTLVEFLSHEVRVPSSLEAGKGPGLSKLLYSEEALSLESNRT